MSKYSAAQLHAISKSYSIKEQKRLERIAKENGYWDEFLHQKKYSSLKWFLKSKAVNGKINNEYI